MSNQNNQLILLTQVLGFFHQLNLISWVKNIKFNSSFKWTTLVHKFWQLKSTVYMELVWKIKLRLDLR